MHKKLFLVTGWFLSAPAFLVLMLANLQYFHQLNARRLSKSEQVKIELSPVAESGESGRLQIAAGGPTSQVLSATIVTDDARPWLLQQYLQARNSPLAPYADLFVKNADLYNFDYRLLVAIAGCESNWGRRMPTRDSYNAWGIAVYTGQLSGASFKNWPSAIAWVSGYFKEKYLDRGINDLRQISAIWAPPSVDTGYSWANCVESMLGEIY